MSDIVYRPIGVVHSPIKDSRNAPRQPKWSNFEGEIEIFPEFVEGLNGIEKLNSIVVVFHFDRSEGYDLMVQPPHLDSMCGVFASRSPRRPNQIGISTLKLLSVAGNILRVYGIDMLDGTPVIDIKPDISGSFFEKQG
jgi:tRNA-Thr(GGU) m(6)t(6)A37 methyltransferase TsaA